MRAKFFYAHGTSFAFRQFQDPISEFLGALTEIGDRILNPAGVHEPAAAGYVAGLNGFSAPWPGAPVFDPFCKLLDDTIWDADFVQYPANFIAMGPSIDDGIAYIKAKLDAMTVGTPWALGGFSQGAAVVSGILEEAQSGSLTAHYPYLLGGVTFGNPRRKTNWRGPIGGTWSGAWDVPDGSTTGGGGSFPDSGPWKRLTNPPDTWAEFAAPFDMFSSVGSSNVGSAWRTANSIFLNVFQGDVLAELLRNPSSVIDATLYAFLDIGGPVNLVIDALGQPWQQGGNGHTIYPWWPPPDANGVIPTTTVNVDGEVYRAPAGDTCYQLAIRYLNSLFGEWNTAPIVVPDPAPIEPAWSTTLTTASAVQTAGWSTTL